MNAKTQGNDGVADVEIGPTPEMGKKEFGRRLYSLMTKRGWRQSDLSRQAGIPRASISTYILGRTLPTDENLAKLAVAFGTTPGELMPSRSAFVAERSEPEIELKVTPNEPSMSWLKVNRAVSTATALKIVEMLNADSATHRGRNSGAA